MPETSTLDAPDEKVVDRASFRLAAFGAVLVVVLFAGYGIGRLNESMPTAAAPVTVDNGHGHAAAQGVAPHDDTGTAPHVHNADGTVTSADGTVTSADGTVASTAGTAAGSGSVGGLAVSSAGLTMVPASTTFAAGRAQPLRFTITAAGGAPVTTYAVVHDKALHLVLIRRDLSGFQHLHPTMAPDGTWSVPLTLAEPGSYRAIADFTAVVGGRQIPVTLGVDLTVAGNYAPVTLPAPARQAVTTGFQVSYEGEPRTGATQPLMVSVNSAGKSAALEPYLGAYGHLVVLREGDVGYVHVHPEAQLVDGKVKFWLAAPGPGRYRMFFDFQVAGQVHTAAWTAVVS